MEKKFPLPPFTQETALLKVQNAEDAWNSKDPERVSLAYTIDTEWRNRDQFINGREEVVSFLTDKWKKNRITGLKRNFGLLPATGLQLDLNMNLTMNQDSGIALMAMKTGNSTQMV